MRESSNCSKTTEQIKKEISMPSLLDQYGIKIDRAHRCKCFAHNDSHPSMRVYPESVYCFACGYTGDIFKVYQYFNKCDFKTAYLALGGAYEKRPNNISAEIQRHKFEAQKAEQKAKEQAEHKFQMALLEAMECCKLADLAFEVGSDDWKYLIDKRDWLNYCYEEKYINGKEINEIDVYRECKQIRHRFYSVR